MDILQEYLNNFYYAETIEEKNYYYTMLINELTQDKIHWEKNQGG